jgi:hypothetical protein
MDMFFEMPIFGYEALSFVYVFANVFVHVQEYIVVQRVLVSSSEAPGQIVPKIQIFQRVLEAVQSFHKPLRKETVQFLEVPLPFSEIPESPRET